MELYSASEAGPAIRFAALGLVGLGALEHFIASKLGAEGIVIVNQNEGFRQFLLEARI